MSMGFTIVAIPFYTTFVWTASRRKAHTAVRCTLHDSPSLIRVKLSKSLTCREALRFKTFKVFVRHGGVASGTNSRVGRIARGLLPLLTTCAAWFLIEGETIVFHSCIDIVMDPLLDFDPFGEINSRVSTFCSLVIGLLTLDKSRLYERW